MEWSNGNVAWGQPSPMKFQSPAAPANDYAANYLNYSPVAMNHFAAAAAMPTQTFQTVEMQTFQSMVPEIEYVPVAVEAPQVEYVPVQLPPQIEYVQMQVPIPQPLPPSPPLVDEGRRHEQPPPKVIRKEVEVGIERLVVREEFVPVEKIVEKIIEKEIETPVTVFKEVPVEKITYRDFEVPIEKIIENKVWREIKVPVLYEDENEKKLLERAQIEKEIQRERERELERQMERAAQEPIQKYVIREVVKPITVTRTVEREVEKIIENIIQVPVERVIEKLIPIEVPIEKIVEKVVYREPEVVYSPPVAPRNVGVGLMLERTEGSNRTYVDRIVPGFAAQLSGLFQVGDTVLSINGVAVEAMPLEAIKKLTIGPEHTKVSMEMLRPSGQSYVADLERQLPKYTNDANAEASQVLVDR